MNVRKSTQWITLLYSAITAVIISIIILFSKNYFDRISFDLLRGVVIFIFLFGIYCLISLGFYFIQKNVKKALNSGLLILVISLALSWTIYEILHDGNFLRYSILAFLNGLAMSMVLFLMVSGFYLVFGLADIINFAHGAFFMLGGFVGFEAYVFYEDLFLQANLFNQDPFIFSIIIFILSILTVALLMGLLGFFIEITTIRSLYKKPLNQILLTVGISFVIIQASRVIWGQLGSYIIPTNTKSKYFFITGNINLPFDVIFESYSVIIIIIGLSLAVFMFLVFKKTKAGLLVQAAIEDSEMTEILGVNVKRMLSLVFIIGTVLAGIAGFLIVPSLHGGANISNGTNYLLYAFVIVVVGGAHYGKFEGTFFGSLIIGFSYNFTSLFFPDFTTVIVFLTMVLILIFKPNGLTGQQLN